MTFEGSNFDILAGLSAPLVFYLGFVKINLTKNTLLLWNAVCLPLSQLQQLSKNSVLSDRI